VVGISYPLFLLSPWQIDVEIELIDKLKSFVLANGGILMNNMCSQEVLSEGVQVQFNVADAASVTNWGTGAPRREFLHVDDKADACLHLLEHYDGPEQVNVGTGSDVTIREIAETVAKVVGFEGETEWDTSKPDGTPQKLLDVSKLADAGWVSRIGLEEGLRTTVEWFRENHASLRE